MTDKSLISVFINHSDDKSLYTGIYRSRDNILVASKIKENFLSSIEKSYITKKSKIFWENEPLGYIYVIASNEQMVAFLMQKFIQMNILVLLIIFAISATLLLTLRKIIINPVSRLKEEVNHFADTKDYSTRVDTNLIGELGNLAFTFNRMIIELEISNQKRIQLLEKLNNQNVELQQEILERQQIEKSLIMSESKYQDLYNTMIDSFISLDFQGNIIEMNPAFLRLSGYQQEALQNQQLDAILEENLFGSEALFRTQLFNQGHTEVFENKLLTSSKIKVPVEIRGHLTEDSSGMPHRAWIIIRNISERKNAEMQILQAQKMETVGNLAGGLAHDFNNVLGAIVGNTSLIKLLIKSETFKYEDLTEYIDTIEKASDRAKNMVQQLLAISRKQELSLAPVDLNLSVKHIFSICDSTFDKSVSLLPIFMFDTATVNADPTQIEQAILNLMVNAYHSLTIMRKESEKQGGEIKVTVGKITEPLPEMIRNSANKNYFFIEVTDNGVGIEDTNKEKIFEPFFSTKEKDKGTGLGLSMVYNIIKRLHGYIDVKSELGKGSTFTIYLPEYVASIKDKTTDSLVNAFTPGSGVILIVDDEIIIRKTAQKILNLCGYETIIAANGREAIEIYKNDYEKINLIILDMVMPEMSGKEVYIALKEINPKLRTLMASGFIQDERVIASMKLGVNAFIQKPYNLSQLSEKVKEVMDINL